ncbi:hypothetical protein Tco_1484576 [Tanacetum coccineum]
MQIRGATNQKTDPQKDHRWVPTGKTFTSSTTKVERNPQMVKCRYPEPMVKANIALNVSADLVPQRQEMSIENVSSGLVPQGQQASDYDNSDTRPPRQNVCTHQQKRQIASQQRKKFVEFMGNNHLHQFLLEAVSDFRDAHSAHKSFSNLSD